MLSYSEASNPAKALAVHYSKQVGDDNLVRFMSGQSDIQGTDAAIKIIEGFWKMTDIAIEDYQHGKQIEGIDDIEFWMHKLFNKVYGYMVKHGFENEWDNASQIRRG